MQIMGLIKKLGFTLLTEFMKRKVSEVEEISLKFTGVPSKYEFCRAPSY
jgi:hypothetical protein